VSLFILALLITANARAGEKQPTAIVELGPAGEWGLPGTSSCGPSLAVEFTPIKDWLEIEVGAAHMFHRGGSEWDTDLLFKKPFTLSDKLEFMVGVGPQWTFSREGIQTGAEFAPRLHVLAHRGSKVRLVSGARLQLLFQSWA